MGEIKYAERVLVEMAADGLTGWGEAQVDAIPFYTWETVETAWHISRDLIAPRVLARPWSSPAELASDLDSFRGHSFTKAAFEAAFWDLLGQREKLSVASMLGGTRKETEVGPSIGIKASPKDLIETVSAELSLGRRRVKVKVSPGYDLEYLTAVRDAFPEISLMADANSAYTPDDRKHLASWDKFNLLMIEQPYNQLDLYHHSLLCKQMRTPICLDESIESVHLADCALKMQAADVINIKVGRVAGLVNARRVHDLCLQAGIPVWIGTRVGTGLAEAMGLAAASLSGVTLPSDLVLCSSCYLKQDILAEPIPIRDGCWAQIPFERPGIGVTVDRELCKHYTVKSLTLDPSAI